MIRALVDANLLISFLLTSSSSPVIAIVRAAIGGHFRMLVASETIAEVRNRTATKPYLAARISADDLDALLRTLRGVAEIVPALSGEIPFVSRDRKDDYLLTQAVRARADYLVTGDLDLLILGRHDGVEIVSPSAFAVRLGLVSSDGQ